MPSDPMGTPRHTECGRLDLLEAAAELSRLLQSGTVMPRPLRMQVAATVSALMAEADATEDGTYVS